MAGGAESAGLLALEAVVDPVLTEESDVAGVVTAVGVGAAVSAAGSPLGRVLAGGLLVPLPVRAAAVAAAPRADDPSDVGIPAAVRVPQRRTQMSWHETGAGRARETTSRRT